MIVYFFRCLINTLFRSSQCSLCIKFSLSCEVDSVFVSSSYSLCYRGCHCWLTNCSNSCSENSQLHLLFYGDGTIMLKFRHEFAYFISYVWTDCLSFFQQQKKNLILKVNFFSTLFTHFFSFFFRLYRSHSNRDNNSNNKAQKIVLMQGQCTHSYV